MIGPVLLAVALAQAEPPTTVNGIEIGPAADFATPGPATVCMREMRISPQAGETAYLSYSGIHNGAIALETEDGEFVVFTLGEIFRSIAAPGQGPVIRDAERRIYRRQDGADLDYQVHIYRPSGYEDEEPGWDSLVMITGNALSGNRADHRYFDRLSFDFTGEQPCDRQYGFGWDIIFGEEALESTPVDDAAARAAED